VYQFFCTEKTTHSLRIKNYGENMCGIFGIVTKQDQVLGPTLIEAGRWLSYRGYDTVGCATLDENGNIDLRKDVGKVDEVAERLNFKEMSGSRGIMQLRWATFGKPSQINAQPHLESDGDLVGAHNGNVVNNVELRQQFIAEGMTVRSENDGESCVHAVERYVDQGFDMIDSIRRAYNDLEGDYAFVIGRVGEDRLYAIKKGSGLVVGLAEETTCLSSDMPSILPLTRRVLRVEDGEIVTIWADGAELHRVEDGSRVDREPETVTETMASVQKGGYPHFMLKEIHEQPVVAGELLRLLERSSQIEPVLERLAAARHLYLVGCGTSYHACIAGAVYFSRLPLVCGYEISVPATKTFSNQVIAFLYLAKRLGKHPTDPLHRLPDLLSTTITTVEDQVAALEPVVTPWDDLYCLGYGLTFPMALEGALKLKEITYAHCEGMLSTEFKHGPLSAVTDGYPVIFVVGPEDVPLIVSGINEVTCRGAHAIAIGEDDPRLRANAQDVIVVPRSTPEINTLLSVIPLQLLSYQISLARGYDPDFPRNLSKTLTVD
jgi:glucosamine 6-phosphate synthetase-like amidotransferase/phosphosugar isomerase protein